MWIVTFYRDDADPIEVKVPSADAKTRVHAILVAVRKKPGVIDESDDMDVLEVPDDLEEEVT